MVNYALGKIYKITGGGLTYVGSTCSPRLCTRMAQHKSAYKFWVIGQCGPYMTSYKVLQADENATIELLESYPCANKDELRMRESFYIKSIECVNKVQAYRSPEEAKEVKRTCDRNYKIIHKEEIRDQQKEHYTMNIETYKERHHKYYIENKAVIIAKTKEYRAAHSEDIKANSIIYRAKNWEKIYCAPHIICVCGSPQKSKHMARHCRTKIHLDFIAKSTATED